jgi:hypothetical protein
VLEPKEIDIDGKKYIIHKYPAWQGILLVGKIPQALNFDHPDEEARGKVWAEVFTYVAIPMPKGGTPLFLTNPDLINNHVKGWPQMLKLFKAISEYNDGFLEDGKL